MTQHYSDTRKIDPTKGATLPDGTPNDNDRVEIGPTQLAFREWEAAGLTLPDLAAMRDYRWKRLTQAHRRPRLGGLLMFDPLNIRYATDTTNMQLWNTHNPFRAVLLCADGYMVIWDYKNSPFLDRPSTRWSAKAARARRCSTSSPATEASASARSLRWPKSTR